MMCSATSPESRMATASARETSWNLVSRLLTPVFVAHCDCYLSFDVLSSLLLELGEHDGSAASITLGHPFLVGCCSF